MQPGVGERLASGSPELLEELGSQFAEQNHIRLPGFFERGLLADTAAQLAGAEFEAVKHDVGSEWLIKHDALIATLNWLVNSPELIRAVRQVSGRAEIGYFKGRAYRLDPSPDQTFHWHDDRADPTRLVAMSVNLGDRGHAGGVLELREKEAPDEILEVPNVGPGDAVLFRVADHLEHRVTPVEGTVSRLAFTGWFRAGPSYHDLLLGRARATAAPDSA